MGLKQDLKIFHHESKACFVIRYYDGKEICKKEISYYDASDIFTQAVIELDRMGYRYTKKNIIIRVVDWIKGWRIST